MIQSSRASSSSSWPGPPAGVAGEDARAPQRDLVVVDDLLLLVLEGEEADVAGDELRRRLGLLVLGEHEHRRRLHRPADVDGVLGAGEVLEVRAPPRRPWCPRGG